MGIFTRVSNILKAKVNSKLDTIENPIELLDQKIKDMEEQLCNAKINAATVLGNTKALENQISIAEKESTDYDSKVKLALSKGNEDLAKRALAKKLEADKKVETLKSTYLASKSKSDTLKQNLLALEEEIRKTKEYRADAAARYSSAKATKQVNEILSEVNSKNNSIKIDDIERKISSEEALSNGLSEFRNVDTFESEFEKLNTVDLDSELEKYKKQ